MAKVLAKSICGLPTSDLANTHLFQVSVLLLPPRDILQPVQPGSSDLPLLASGCNYLLNGCKAPALYTPLQAAKKACDDLTSQCPIYKAAPNPPCIAVQPQGSAAPKPAKLGSKDHN